MKGKGLRVNIGKTKVVISGLDMLQKSVKDPCGVCLKGVSTNSSFCGGCSSWIHKKCGGIPGCLKFDISSRCKPCTGQARPIDSILMTEVTVGQEALKVVPSFCYLGDCLSSTRYYHKMPCCMGQIQWAPARPHLPLISHYLQRKSLQFMCQECHAPCRRNLGPNLIGLASPAT